MVDDLQQAMMNGLHLVAVSEGELNSKNGLHPAAVSMRELNFSVLLRSRPCP